MSELSESERNAVALALHSLTCSVRDCPGTLAVLDDIDIDQAATIVPVIAALLDARVAEALAPVAALAKIYEQNDNTKPWAADLYEAIGVEP